MISLSGEAIRSSTNVAPRSRASIYPCYRYGANSIPHICGSVHQPCRVSVSREKCNCSRPRFEIPWLLGQRGGFPGARLECLWIPARTIGSFSGQTGLFAQTVSWHANASLRVNFTCEYIEVIEEITIKFVGFNKDRLYYESKEVLSYKGISMECFFSWDMLSRFYYIHSVDSIITFFQVH